MCTLIAVSTPFLVPLLSISHNGYLCPLNWKKIKLINTEEALNRRLYYLHISSRNTAAKSIGSRLQVIFLQWGIYQSLMQFVAWGTNLVTLCEKNYDPFSESSQSSSMPSDVCCRSRP